MPLGFRRAFCALILASAFISPLKSEFSIATFTVPDQLKVRASQSHLLAFGLSLRRRLSMMSKCECEEIRFASPPRASLKATHEN